MGPASSVVRDAGRRRPSVSEAEPELHDSIFDEEVPLSPRATQDGAGGISEFQTALNFGEYNIIQYKIYGEQLSFCKVHRRIGVEVHPIVFPLL